MTTHYSNHTAEPAAWPFGYGKCCCGCGATTNIAKYNVKTHGIVRGLPMRFISGHNDKRRDLTGQTFGRWYVVGPAVYGNGRSRGWLCRCACGTERVHETSRLLAKTPRFKTRSCGCYRREQQSFRARQNIKHGLSRTPEYKSWRAMMTRCYNADAVDYDRYGGRGITVCEQWHNVVQFFADMGPRPSSEYSLDRIEVNGPYSPENCRWATRIEQANNKRRTIRLTWNNQTLSLLEWAVIVDIPVKFLYYRYQGGLTDEDILTRPLRGNGLENSQKERNTICNEFLV